MQYTISSRGQPIGTTDLAFLRFDESSRSGWFHPNAAGEASVHKSIVQPSFLRSSLLADLAESFHHAESLALTLHGADGTPIPTTMIGIQDTEQLLELSRCSDPYEPSDPLPAEGDDAVLAREIDGAVEHDAALLRFGWHEPDDDPAGCFDEANIIDEPWLPDDEATPFPRYQVHVLLAQVRGIA